MSRPSSTACARAVIASSGWADSRSPVTAAFKFVKRDEDSPDPVGVHSAKQQRSQRKHDALLRAGRRLLDAQDLAALSVAQLTRDAGMSVGSFYSRFDDKNAWFGELLRVTGEAVLADTRALLESARWQRAAESQKATLIVRHIVGIHREHRGIFRSALSDATRSARFWAPMHGYGVRIAEAVYQGLRGQMQQVPRSARRLRVGFGLQAVYGTLVNAVLHDPGPVALDDPRMERELTRVFLAALRLG